MALKSINPTTTKAWKELLLHFEESKDISIKSLFATDSNRIQNFHIKWQDFVLDFSKNRISDKTLHLLNDLAKEVALSDAIEKYFSGDNINKTENRAVLHTALRKPSAKRVLHNQAAEIELVKHNIRNFSDQIISGARKGFTGKNITDVVNIGIGGSDLGPAMVTDALAFYKNHLNVHFISNVDGDHVREVLQKVNPETTLFVIVSKTFTTQETLTNSETVRNWFLAAAKVPDIEKHFVAVSCNVDAATNFGIEPGNIFPMWDWVGGRFSLWSAVGLTISLGIGHDNFEQLLLGAHQMDEHFRETPFRENIPVTLALIGIWYNNFYGCQSEVVIPYTQYLKKLPAYLQQSSMESNGKSVDRDGNSINYQSASILWGQTGTNAQHAFFQLLHQGTKLIPADFIGLVHSLHGDSDHHDKLMSNFFAQTEALMNGKSTEEVEADMRSNNEQKKSFLIPFKAFDGNKPTNTILIDVLTPKSLGSLIAMYEHKIFVQGIIWNIFSFDQWGVELGKKLANSILEEITTGTCATHDSSTQFLLTHYRTIGSQSS